MASKWRMSILSIASAIAVMATAVPASVAAASTTPAAGVTIQIDQTGKCLNVSGGSTANGAKVVTYTCSATGTNDRWQLVPQGDYRYQVKGIQSGKCLTVSGASLADKAAIITYTCNTGLNELWYVDEIFGRPTVRLMSANSGKCINVPGASTANNIQLVQYGCTLNQTGANERLYFPPTTSPSPVKRGFTLEQPVAAVQGGAPSGGGIAPIHYSYLDDSHQLHMLTVSGWDPQSEDDPSSWDVSTADLYGFTGPTSIAKLADGRVQVAAHDAATGDTYLSDESAVGTGDHPFIDTIGGTGANDPTVGLRVPSTGALGVFSIVNGALWYAPEQVNDPQPALGAWRNLGGPDLIGTPVTAPASSGVQVFALNSERQMFTATLSNTNVLSTWTNLGGVNMEGTPAVATLPGNRRIVFANTMSGTIVYRKQEADLTWVSDWTPIEGLTAVGNPTAAVQPYAGTVTVASRDNTGHLYYAAETAKDSGIIGAWQNITTPDEPLSETASDPTLFTYDVPSGKSFGIAFDHDGSEYSGPVTFSFPPNTSFPAAPAGALAKAKANAKTTAGKPELHQLIDGKTKVKKDTVEATPVQGR